MDLLEVRKLGKHFGGVVAIQNLDFEIQDAEIVGLIGPNGAGKTTFFNLLTGFLKCSFGEMIFDGQKINNLRPDQIASKRIIRTFQLSSLFMNFSTLENVLVANQLYCRNLGQNIFTSLLARRKRDKLVLERSLLLLEEMGLEKVKETVAMNLPHGYQRALGITMALSCDPRLLLIDEPLTGMNMEEAKFLIHKIVEAREKGIAIIIVEHNLKAVKDISDRIVVLNDGQKIAEGTPVEIVNDQKVIDILIGEKGL